MEKFFGGKLRIENSGMELTYSEPYMDEADGHIETSFVIYKAEYGEIKRLIRYIDTLSAEDAKLREQDHTRTSNPSWFMRIARKMRNFFGTVRDSFTEIANVLLGKMRTSASFGKALAGQDKYVSHLPGSSHILLI